MTLRQQMLLMMGCTVVALNAGLGAIAAIVLKTTNPLAPDQVAQFFWWFLSGSILGMGLVLAAITLQWGERRIFSRLAKLSAEVSAINDDQLARRVSEQGQDELTDLAVRINTLLADLEDDKQHRQRTETALRQSEATNRALIDAIPDLILRIHQNGTYLDVVEAKGVGIVATRQNRVGKHVDDVLPAAVAQQYLQDIHQAIQSGETQKCEYQLLVNERLGDYEARTVRISDTEAILVVRDITDRKQAEIALHRSVAAAEAANRAKSTFLANMSHELRTPLNVILGFSQLLLRGGSLNPQQQEYLDSINRGGEHLLTLINDVLEMAKIEAGRVTLNPHDMDLAGLLHWLYQMFQMKSEAKGLQLLVEPAANLPSYIHTDESKLRQVLVNLVGNAVKFTQDGAVALRVKPVEPPRPSTADRAIFLQFEVEDTGPGIAADDLSRLFQPFVQTESGQTSQEGTGLGLAISQKFVNLLGGKITVNSTLGMGTIFRFTMPTTIAAHHPQSTAPRRTVIGLAPDQPRYRILVVEDKAENRQILQELLTSVGFAVQLAVNGLEAIAQWESWQPHLIWMDIRMPVMNGYEATKRIKAVSDRANGPAPIIIALTGSVFEEDRKIALASGCNDFVRKPFQADSIFTKMSEFLGVRYEYGTEPASPSAAFPAVMRPPAAPATTAADLALMPADWLAELQQAASRANHKQLLHLIAQMPPAAADLAKKLTELVNNFGFEEIVDLINGKAG